MITKQSTIEDIKSFVKSRIENVPNKTLIYSYVFNDKGFGQLFNLTDNKNKLVINNYNEFITNEVIENFKNWYFDSKEYMQSLKKGDKIDVYNYGSLKDGGIITKINYGRGIKNDEIITSINYDYNSIREDGSTYNGKSQLRLKDNPTASIIWKGLKIKDIKEIRNHIIRGGGSYGKYDLKKAEYMKNIFYSINSIQ